MSFLYPGLNIDLCFHLDSYDRKVVYPSLSSNHGTTRKFYPIGASPMLPGSQSPVLQIREVAMMMLMNSITDKEKWHEKVFDENIAAKWKQEAMEMPERGLYERIMWEKHTDKIPFPDQGRILSETALDFCIAELRDKAKYFHKTSLVPALDSKGNSVIKSDTLIPESLLQQLGEVFRVLKADQRGHWDWHPGSNETQLNLVHPSMYPLIWGRSTYFPEEVVGTQDAITWAGRGETTPEHTTGEQTSQRSLYSHGGNTGRGKASSELWSSNYQWLPSVVSFQKNGQAEFTSYINNLNPNKYCSAYETLGMFVDAVIPAWDQCLQEVEILRAREKEETKSRAGRQETRFEYTQSASDSDDGKWVPFDLDYWKKSDAKLTNPQLRRLNERCYREKGGRTTYLSLEEQEEHHRREIEYHRCEKTGERMPTPYASEEDLAREKGERYRTAIYPEPVKYKTVNYTPTHSIRDMFMEHGLQIIVKMASIELTPEKPDFPGGSWHIEGQMKERICATALYYVHCENVTPSKLAFHMSTEPYFGNQMDVEQDEYNWLERIYGVSLGHSGGLPDACLQTYGDVETRQGRVLAFPNVFQHRVSPFSLKDKSKPGHRQFVALWLVDPHQRIMSTANVPP